MISPYIWHKIYHILIIALNALVGLSKNLWLAGDFFTGQMPFCHPTNSVKTLKEQGKLLSYIIMYVSARQSLITMAAKMCIVQLVKLSTWKQWEVLNK